MYSTVLCCMCACELICMMACTRGAVCSPLLDKSVQRMRRWLHRGCSGSGTNFLIAWGHGGLFVRGKRRSRHPSGSQFVLVFCWLKMMARYSWNEWFWSRNQFPYQYKQNTVPALDLFFFFFVAARGDRSSTRSAHLITSSSDKRRAAQVLAPCGHSGHVVISCLELKEGKEAME
jgi:hypothetical protein